MFEDNVNKQNPGGGRVSMSNLCITGDSLVDIAPNQYGEGFTTISIEELIEILKGGELYDELYVRSHNGENQVWELLEGIAHPRTVSELIEIEYENKTLRCTFDHEIWTENRGWVEAQNLKEDDILNIS
jgi:intein/homing endonuclease